MGSREGQKKVYLLVLALNNNILLAETGELTEGCYSEEDSQSMPGCSTIWTPASLGHQLSVLNENQSYSQQNKESNMKFKVAYQQSKFCDMAVGFMIVAT